MYLQTGYPLTPFCRKLTAFIGFGHESPYAELGPSLATYTIPRDVVPQTCSPC